MIRRRVLTTPEVTGGRPDRRSAPPYPRPVIRRRAALLLAAAVALGACGGSEGAEVAAPSGEPLDFVAPDVRGGRVVGADLAGKDLVIWFWAPW